MFYSGEDLVKLWYLWSAQPSSAEKGIQLTAQVQGLEAPCSSQWARTGHGGEWPGRRQSLALPSSQQGFPTKMLENWRSIFWLRQEKRKLQSQP